jgi:hypothetical protein
VKLEILDSTGKLVRSISAAQRKEPTHTPPMAIAERWIPKPIVLATTPGAHRFEWDLRWGSSGANAEVDEEGFGAPRGPRAAPGNYQLKLTVDGSTLTQPLKLTMDPRSQATAAQLNEQQRLGLEIFSELRSARKAQAEIGAVKKQIAGLPAQFLSKHQETLTAVTSLNAQIERIEKGEKAAPSAISGLDSASMGLGAALRVVENSDRAIPSQAIELYQESDRAAKTGVADWNRLKSQQLNKLNESLKKSGQGAIQISEIEQEVEYLLSQ